MKNNIMKIFGSASKTVFMLIAITACISFALGALSENNFMLLAGAAFTFYFSSKGDQSLPYGGK